MSAADQELYQQARAVIPSLSYPYFMGMTGLAGRLEFVSLFRACPNTTPTMGELSRGLSTLGLEIQSNILAAGPLSLRRIQGRVGLKSAREIGAVAWLAAELRSPPTPHRCSRKNSVGWKLRGKAALSALFEELDAARLSASARQTALDLASHWRDQLAVAADFCSEIAGTGGTPYARRLMLAADSLYSASTALPEAKAAMNRKRSPREALRMSLNFASEELEISGGHLIDSACRGGHLSPVLMSALAEPTSVVLNWTALQEVIYLARSGSVPFRRLAAMRLAGSNSGQSIATLGQLLFDPTPAIARTALFSLVEAAGVEPVPLIGRAFSGLMQDEDPSDELLASMILLVKQLGIQPDEMSTDEASQTVRMSKGVLPLTWAAMRDASRD